MCALPRCSALAMAMGVARHQRDGDHERGHRQRDAGKCGEGSAAQQDPGPPAEEAKSELEFQVHRRILLYR
jgi:hypothetical protein